MPTTAFRVEFDFALEEIPRTIHLTASVELHDPESYYLITDIMGCSNKVVLPNQYIQKMGNEWVHTDSQKPSNLSLIIGKAIDKELAMGVFDSI